MDLRSVQLTHEGPGSASWPAPSAEEFSYNARPGRTSCGTPAQGEGRGGHEARKEAIELQTARHGRGPQESQNPRGSRWSSHSPNRTASSRRRRTVSRTAGPSGSSARGRRKVRRPHRMASMRWTGNGVIRPSLSPVRLAKRVRPHRPRRDRGSRDFAVLRDVELLHHRRERVAQVLGGPGTASSGPAIGHRQLAENVGDWPGASCTRLQRRTHLGPNCCKGVCSRQSTALDVSRPRLHCSWCRCPMASPRASHAAAAYRCGVTRT